MRYTPNLPYTYSGRFKHFGNFLGRGWVSSPPPLGAQVHKPKQMFFLFPLSLSFLFFFFFSSPFFFFFFFFSRKKSATGVACHYLCYLMSLRPKMPHVACRPVDFKGLGLGPYGRSLIMIIGAPCITCRI